MEVTALCIGLLTNVLMVVVAQVHCPPKDAFPCILPNRLQFFEYESINFTCEFDCVAEWSVMRTLENIVPTNISNWVTSAGSGTIKPAFSSDSGAYWCEDRDGLRSNAVNISVTAGLVILETPVLPVMEGDTVTLSCKKKKTPDDLAADFYKDGLHIRTEYKGKMTLYNVSTSDEGLYKCNISGAGGSPESRLAVRGFKNVSGPEEKTDPPPAQPTSRPQSQHRNFHTLLWIVGTVLLVALLLLVLGVLYCRIHKGEGSTTRGNCI
ncbi:low affinity immunoglobulin gamma Fc region receptor II-a-like [Epinephelus moara]|uniref:low affinity immunoglobulin gamma Fc region receptor II-a-like n=1 Tax=Epinephelus moara TaxID=300413 RepID=UPI00214E087D|nr:low affinity immunoglobulin gamma Fc region receptor II-a-like [Epinephelus moara]